MTPFELNILLHYYYSSADWQNGDHNKHTKDTLGRFMDDGLVDFANFQVERFEDGTLMARYKLTERGLVYVKAILAVPLPERVWVIPAQAERRVSDEAAL